ncbi:MAG: hypothetical protein WCC03_21865 [Candidatus Acidiferrales bacterium]
MEDFTSDIDSALTSEGQIAKDLVLSWIERASSLSTLSKLYRLTGEGYYRIQPELGADPTCALIQRYLIQCIRENVEDDDDIESRFDAAMSLHTWFRHLLKMTKDEILKRAAHSITELYLTSDDAIRDAVENGFLEHALETAALRPYFEYWSRDERLRDAWKRALEWGQAHPDDMEKMFQRLGQIKS